MRYCDLCGKTTTVTTVLKDVADNEGAVDRGFDIVSCDVCGHCFTDPQPASPEEISSYYPDRYYAHHFTLLDASNRRIALKLRLQRIHYALQRGEKVGWADRTVFVLLRHTVNEPDLRPGGRLLDVGCGGCDYLMSLAGSGWTTEGVEPSARSVEAAQAHGLKVRQGTAEETGAESGVYDVVRMWNVLEHTRSPRAALAEAARLLRPGGRLVLYVPNFHSLECEIFGRHWMSLEIPRHLHHFKPETLRAFLEKTGFRFERWWYPGTPVSTLAPTLRIMKKDSVSGPRRWGSVIRLMCRKLPRRIHGRYDRDVGLALAAVKET